MAIIANTAPASASARTVTPVPARLSALHTPDDAGKLLLRVMLGALILLHGIAKVRGGIDPIIDVVANIGLPPVVAYCVYLGEVVAPLLLIAGLWTRLAAGVIAINMVAAIVLMHSTDLGALLPTGGWAIELQALYLAMALAIVLLGAGRLALGNASVSSS